MSVKWTAVAAMICAAGVLATAPVPAAATAHGQTITLGGPPARLPRAEADDLRAYEAALGDFERRGFPGLNAHRARLMRALERAPERYPAFEVSGDRVIVRSTDMADGLMLSIMAMAAAGEAGQGTERTVVTQPNVYPMIALMLGSAAVERQDYQEAIRIMDLGLALQPQDRFLLTERIAALQGLRKWDEALRAADAALASGDLLITSNAGSLHRKRGFSLIELGRLDEAQAAYEESLKSEPDNAAALHEIEYIRELRAGRPPVPGQLVAPAAAPSPGQP